MKDTIKGLEINVNAHEKHLNGIEQYLRVNNLEIVGLPTSDSEGVPIEDALIDTFISLPELSSEVSPNDIDICQIMPSDLKDQKLVAVCRFRSRKTKFDILEAKRK